MPTSSYTCMRCGGRADRFLWQWDATDPPRTRRKIRVECRRCGVVPGLWAPQTAENCAAVEGEHAADAPDPRQLGLFGGEHGRS